MGTRFYRVKAIPWKKSEEQRADRMSASVSNPSGPAVEETAVLTEPITSDMSTSCHPKIS